MSNACAFLRSSVGKKYIMGISGLIWAGFVLSHMVGNLLIFAGPDAYNTYGHAITSNYYIIYPAEAVLVLALIAHVFCAISLTRANRKATRSLGNRYAVSPSCEKGGTLASRTMAAQGSLILFFIVSHLATFKYGTVYTTTVNGTEMRDLYRLLLEIFHSPGQIAWYVVALILLGFHLSHGVSSTFQSLGLRPDTHAKLIKTVGYGYSTIVVLGFLAQPLYIFFKAV